MSYIMSRFTLTWF